jgi:hypothetical protein
VGGPACENRITQGLFNEIVKAAPWILDPTVSDARVRGGPRRAPGAWVHGGLATQTEGVCDLVHPSQIPRPRTRASEGRRRARRRQGRHGGASPEVRRRTLARCTRHRFARAWALRVAGEHVSMPRGSGRRRGHPRRPAQEGADRPHRRAR